MPPVTRAEATQVAAASPEGRLCVRAATVAATIRTRPKSIARGTEDRATDQMAKAVSLLPSITGTTQRSAFTRQVARHPDKKRSSCSVTSAGRSSGNQWPHSATTPPVTSGPNSCSIDTIP